MVVANHRLYYDSGIAPHAQDETEERGEYLTLWKVRDTNIGSRIFQSEHNTKSWGVAANLLFD